MVQTEDGPAGAARTRTRTVVLVDDVADLRLLARLALEQHQGWAVVGEAADGDEAVQVCRAHVPDVVLLDLEMPWLDGAEAIPGIRQVAPEASIVIWTVDPSGRRADDARRLGATAVLGKAEITVGHLAEVLERLLGS